jgi:hypothetical protein
MTAERKPGSNRGRAAIDWERAFLFYAALPVERRGYAAVAAEFEVSVRTVERHGHKEGWRARALEIDREAATSAAARLVEQRATRLTDFEKLVEASLVGYAQKLREGKVRLTAADLPRLHKLLRELWEDQVVDVAPAQAPAATAIEDQTAHKAEVLRALHDAGVLQRLQELADAEEGRSEQ